MKNLVKLTKKSAIVLMMAVSANQEEEKNISYLMEKSEFNKEIAEIVDLILTSENVFYTISIVKNLFITNITLFNHILHTLFKNKEKSSTNLSFDKEKNCFHISFNLTETDIDSVKENINFFMKETEEDELYVSLFLVIEAGQCYSEQKLMVEKKSNHIIVSIMPKTEKEKNSNSWSREKYEVITVKNNGETLYDLGCFSEVKSIINDTAFYSKMRSDIRKIILFNENMLPLTYVCFGNSQDVEEFIEKYSLKSINEKEKKTEDIDKVKNKLFNNVYFTLSEEFKEVKWSEESKEDFKKMLYDQIKGWIEKH